MQGMMADYFKARQAACPALCPATYGRGRCASAATRRRRCPVPDPGRILSCAQDISVCAANDEGVSLVLREVGHMVKPPQALFAPGIIGKVALYRLRRLIGRLRPAGLMQTPAAP